MKKMDEDKRVVSSKNLELREWLDLIEPHEDDRDYLVIDYQFPTDSICDEYLASIHEQSEDSVKNLLRRFLIESGGLGRDRNMLEFWMLKPELLSKVIKQTEFGKRMLTDRTTWEGNTWVLDLLPSQPQEAINALNAYFGAHVQFLPDGRIQGLLDAIAIIRARYFERVTPRDSVISLSPRDFEFLTAAIYERIGYKTSVTQSSRDGGIDVEALKDAPGLSEKILIQCKRVAGSIGVSTVRELSGVVESERANKGIIVSTGHFSSASRDFASRNRIELVSWLELNRLMNQHLGADWPLRIDSFITRKKSIPK